jgi:hypothetical protein
VEDLLARQVELAHVAGPGHAPGQFGAGFGGGVHLARVVQRLARRHRLDPGTRVSRACCSISRATSSLTCSKRCASRRAASGVVNSFTRLTVKAAFDGDVAAAGQVLEVQHRIRQPAGLGQVGLGDADLPVAGLQAGMR